MPAGRGLEWEVGFSRFKLLQMAWINNKVLLHSTENCIQYPMINHNGKEYKKKECIHMYNWTTLLHSSNEHNMANQLCFDKKTFLIFSNTPQFLSLLYFLLKYNLHVEKCTYVPLFMRFSRQEYWSGLSFSSPGDLTNPGIEPALPALQADALLTEPPGKPINARINEFA